MPDPATLARGARAAALVSQMAVVTVLGGLVGQQLDTRLQTAPWLLLAGFLGGFAIGLFTFLRFVLRVEPGDDEPPAPPAE